jgi:hypothetical protein
MRTFTRLPQAWAVTQVNIEANGNIVALVMRDWAGFGAWALGGSQAG